MNLKVGSAVVHPMFPQWGRGIISEIVVDTNTNRKIAKVMWQSLKSEKLAFHTMENLEMFKET